jgi:hypothetical protein
MNKAFNIKTIISLGVCVLLGAIFILVQMIVTARATPEKTFSNTQEWDPKYLEFASTTPSLVPDFETQILLPPPPKNTSSITEAELVYLQSLANSRSRDDLERIRQDLNLPDLRFGKESYQALFDPSIRPYSANLIHDVLTDFHPIILYYKKVYDRVRPSYLDPNLTTAIEVPRHAAYPSGHAAQSMLIAFVLSDLDPANAETYKESAESIAYYREVAGVHYPSDSAAGQILATQYFDIIKELDWYETHQAEAKAEW